VKAQARARRFVVGARRNHARRRVGRIAIPHLHRDLGPRHAPVAAEGLLAAVLDEEIRMNPHDAAPNRVRYVVQHLTPVVKAPYGLRSRIRSIAWSGRVMVPSIMMPWGPRYGRGCSRKRPRARPHEDSGLDLGTRPL
jgi:hypothetical protein